MGWDVIDPEETTRRQRACLYKFGLPRSIVVLLTREQASTIIGVLVEAVSTVDTQHEGFANEILCKVEESEQPLPNCELVERRIRAVDAIREVKHQTPVCPC